MKHKFDWLKDGKRRRGYFQFRADGTVHKSFNRSGGTWKALDEKTLWFREQNGTEFTLRFADDFGREALLISPVREPQSKLCM